MSGKYNSSIELDGPGDIDRFLKIEISYEEPVTEQDHELMVFVYQKKFSRKAGREVPREEIYVKPKVGELQEVKSVFTTRLGKPLYIGLRGCSSESLVCVAETD